MGFLLWQPQLLSELWDQVSSGNNWRPLEKIYSEPGNKQKKQGLRGREEGEVGVSQNADQGWTLPHCPTWRSSSDEQGLGHRCWHPNVGHVLRTDDQEAGSCVYHLILPLL